MTAGALAAAGMRVWASGLCFALCAMWATTIGQEFVRGRQRAAPQHRHGFLQPRWSASSRRNKRRYGGYIAHLGFVLICLGFAGNGFKKDETVLLKPGQQTTVGKYTLRNESSRSATTVRSR